jgi:glycosyltransferase involved in cell wall biosynthesis
VQIPYPRSYSHLAAGAISSYYASSWLHQHRSTLDVVFSNGSAVQYPVDICASHFVHSAWMQSAAHPRHERGAHAVYQGLYTLFNSRREMSAYRLAHRIAAVSQKVKLELIDAGIEPGKIEVVVNGVDLNEFHAGDSMREQFNLPQNVPLGLFVGDLKTRRKNADNVLRALAQVPDVHVCFAGALEGSPFPAMARELGLADRTHFIGFVKNTADLMRSADCLIFPSRYEAGTLVVLEALASGLPVITASTAGNCDFVRREFGAVIRDPDSTEELADSMADIFGRLRSRDLRAEIARSSRAAVEGHSWEQMADSYLKLAGAA